MSSFNASKSFGAVQTFGFVLLLGCATILSSCELATNYTKPDRGADMEIQDFRDGLAERLPEADENSTKEKSDAGIPELQPYVMTSAEGIKPMPLVSVSVNQSVPIRDILYELAQQADYDIELDPNIRGSMIFTARNKPFDQVIDRIAKVAGLRYKFNDDFLRVEMDTPYNKIYKIDYLSFIRENQGSVNTSVSVVTGEGADTGSNFSASSSSSSDFWGEIETNLNQILGGRSTGALRTRRDPRVTAAEQNPEVAAVAPTPTAEGAQTTAAEGGSGVENTNVQVQPPEAVLNVESIPVEEEDAAAGSDAEDSGNGSTFTINRQAGLISINATQAQHEETETYLKILRRAVTSQVLIEAKIFEVGLYDEFITGIDWQAVDLGAGRGVFNFLSTSGATSLADLAAGNSLGFNNPPGGNLATAANLAVGYAGNDLQTLVQAISGFGTVRALASPRLTALNNQSAVLNVATNRVFFDIDVDSSDSDDDGTIDTVEVETNVQSVPEGVLVNVQPSINLDNNTVSMSVRPTITRVVGEIRDPGVAFVASTIPGAASLNSLVPEVNVQEIDTVVNVRSGQAMVMGGLLQDRATNVQEGVPVLGEVPLVGNLFKRKSDVVSKTELVIFLKATILEAPEDNVNDADKDLYRAFSGDRRPTKL